MTTSLTNSRIELSRQLNDYWSSTTTSAGAAGGTTLVDTALKAKTNQWIGKDMYDLIVDSTTTAIEEEERSISSLSNTNGTLTVLTHGATVPISTDYEVHRLFTASEKRLALIAAARMAWPHIHEKIWDESMVSGNWLKDGSFEIWTSDSALTYWTTATSTIAKTSTSPYYKHGTYSCKISGTAGTVTQSITNWDDLKRLAGKTVTFSIQAHSNTASSLRISVYDGVGTQTYSSYHDGDSAWTQDNPRNDDMYVTFQIDDNPTEITFTIHHENAAATEYVDDARVIGPYQPRLFIETLGLSQEKPILVEIEPEYYSTDEPWTTVFNSRVNTESGYLYIPSSVIRDRRLRIKGIGYLDFLVAGVSSTAWAATINIDSPQTDILIAQAILYLYTQMALPNFSRSTKQDFQKMIGFWESELRKRIGKNGMEVQSIPVRFK